MRTDVTWLDFHCDASTALDVAHATNIIEARYTRASSQKYVLLVEADGWKTFIGGVIEKVL